MKKKLAFVIVWIVLLALLSGCNTSAENSEDAPVTEGTASETDASAVGRILSVSDSTIKFALGAGGMPESPDGEAPSGDIRGGMPPSGERPEGASPPEDMQENMTPPEETPADGATGSSREALTLSISEVTKVYMLTDGTKKEAAVAAIAVGDIAEVTYDETSLTAITITIQ